MHTRAKRRDTEHSSKQTDGDQVTGYGVRMIAADLTGDAFADRALSAATGLTAVVPALTPHLLGSLDYRL